MIINIPAAPKTAMLTIHAMVALASHIISFIITIFNSFHSVAIKPTRELTVSPSIAQARTIDTATIVKLYAILNKPKVVSGIKYKSLKIAPMINWIN